MDYGEIRRNFRLSVFFFLFSEMEKIDLRMWILKLNSRNLFFTREFNYHWHSLEKLEMRNRDKKN